MAAVDLCGILPIVYDDMFNPWQLYRASDSPVQSVQMIRADHGSSADDSPEPKFPFAFERERWVRVTFGGGRWE